MRHFVFTLIMLLSISLNAKTFVREYTYKAGEADSKITARTIALEQVKRLLLEEVGLYIHSTITNQEIEANGVTFSLTQKDIQVISAGITQTKVLEEAWNGETYRLKAEIKLDEKDVQRRLDEIINDVNKQEQLKQNQGRIDNALSEIDNLKAQLAQEMDKNKQLQLQSDYNTEVGKLRALEYLRQAQDITSRDTDPADAIELLQKAVLADSTLGEAWLELGGCYSLTDNWGLAKTALLKAFELTSNAGALTRLGWCYKMQKDYLTAIKYYTQAYDLSGDPIHLEYMGELYLDTGDYDKAIAIFEDLLRREPENFSYLLYAAHTYRSLKEYNKSINSFLRLISLTTDPPASYYCSLADVYQDKGDLTTAVYYYKKACDKEPEFWLNWMYLAEASFKLPDYPQTIMAAKKVLELAKVNSWAEELIARSYEQQKDSVNARKYYILSAQHNNQNAQTWCKNNNIKW